MHFLDALANVLASASKRVHAYKVLEQRVTERTRELSAILAVSRNVASTLELAPLLGLILDQLKRVVDYTGAAIFTAEGAQVRVVDYRGPLPPHEMLKLRIPLNQALGYQAVSYAKRPVIVDDTGPTHALADRVGDLRAYFSARAGRTVYSGVTGTFVFLAGPHQVVEGDTAGLCATFA